ncbi:MAG TPA: hypothetical protein VHA75_18185 [Rugosimonospora sp.]|nr:hypothetical protein [Rugosimonospora sp.]
MVRPQPARGLRGWGRHGLFDSGPRFAVIVGLLAAATTAPTAAVAFAGHVALSGGQGRAITPMLATGPGVTNVRVPDAGSSTADPSSDPVALIRDEQFAFASQRPPAPPRPPNIRFE